MSFASEFKEFAMKGNVVDLAVGVIIGGAFGKIVDSVVGDLIMPVIGVITGGINFSGLVFTVGQAKIAYGSFIQAVVNFLIIAFVIFLIVRTFNSVQARFRKKEEIQPEPQVNEIVHSGPIPSLDLRFTNTESTDKKKEPKPTVSSSPSQQG